MADGAYGPPQGPESGELRLQHRALEVGPHAGRVTSPEQERIIAVRLDLLPAEGPLERLIPLQLAVALQGLRADTQALWDGPAQREGVGLGRALAGLGREHHGVASPRERVPGDGDLRRIKVAIWQRGEDAAW